MSNAKPCEEQEAAVLKSQQGAQQGLAVFVLQKLRFSTAQLLEGNLRAVPCVLFEWWCWGGRGQPMAAAHTPELLGVRLCLTPTPSRQAGRGCDC